MTDINVVVADDHAVVRGGLKSLLESQTDIHVVAEAADGLEAVEAAGLHRPHVVVMDVSMPRLDGTEATTRIRRDWPEVKVVALTAHEDPSYLRRLLKVGVNGYLLKRTAADELLRAVRAVAAGEAYIDPSLSVVEADGHVEIAASSDEGKLSDRECEVLKQIAAGFSNKQIAAKLALSVKTVETYKARAFAKLEIRSRVQLIQYAVGRGWLSGA